MGQVRGITVLVTGGATGVGAAIVRRLVAEGANAIIADGDFSSAEALAGGLWPNAMAQGLEARSSPEQWASTLRRAQEQFGSVDVLVLADAAPARAEEALASISLGIQAAVPDMNLTRGGSIISVGPARSRKRLISRWKVQSLTQPVHGAQPGAHRDVPQFRLTNAVTFNPSAQLDSDDVARVVLRFTTEPLTTIAESAVNHPQACEKLLA
ncbi:SDR family NAD(P)-dependent oxidoreductase [Streptomyces sp. NPDC051098]|uniref:SDR family NAD(P)-dependent oxidoreductase n=1 Tax=Streptomyces sp. NPDC051098 TaxID=3155411 RepID=UPI003436D8EF